MPLGLAALPPGGQSVEQPPKISVPLPEMGERSWALLNAGQKVCLERSDIKDFRKGYLERLIAHLDEIAAQATRSFRRSR